MNSDVKPATTLRHEPRLLLPLAMIFVATLIISNTIAVKIANIGPFNVAAGIVCFPITYIFADVLVECYGYARTRIVIWTGLACLVVMALFYYLSVVLPPAVFWQGQDAWSQFFSMAPRIVLASLVAYLAGEFVNAVVMSKVKLWTHGRYLWVRTISSTIVGEGVDSVIFALVAFAGIFETSALLSIMMSGFVLKVGYEVLATPLTYIVVGWVKRAEGVDFFDRDLKSYNPFKLAHD